MSRLVLARDRAGNPGLPTTRADLARVAGAPLALGAAAGFAAVTLLGRRPLTGLTATATTACGFTLGGLVLACAVTVSVPAGLGFAVTPVRLVLVGYLGLVPTALAYLLYFAGLRTVQSGPAALVALLEPLTAAALGALLLGERLGLPGTVGALLVAAAVLLSRRP